MPASGSVFSFYSLNSQAHPRLLCPLLGISVHAILICLLLCSTPPLLIAQRNPHLRSRNHAAPTPSVFSFSSHSHSCCTYASSHSHSRFWTFYLGSGVSTRLLTIEASPLAFSALLSRISTPLSI